MQNELLFESFAGLYLNEELSDVNFIFKTGGEIQKVPANKAILASVSPVFHIMFFGPMKEKQDVEIKDSSAEAFKEFLKLFYLAMVTFPMENIEAVVRLADKYDVLDRVHACATYLQSHLTMDNVCWAYQLAIFLNNEKLKEFCSAVISVSSLEIFKSDAFRHCEPIVLKNILQIKQLNCTEADVFDAGVNWAKSACKQNGRDENKGENLRAQLGDCFNFIRFGAMKVKEFATLALSSKEMFTAEELSEIFFATVIKEFTSNKFKKEPRSITSSVISGVEALKCTLDKLDDIWCEIKCNESVWFSVNDSIRLANIGCTEMASGIDVVFDITIFEVADPFTEAQTKTGYKGKVNSGGQLQLNPPLLISPLKIYEIKFDPSDIGGFYYASFATEIKLDDRYIINFNPKHMFNKATGLISFLCFNRL